ncbi:hypothetical protein EDB84DRAFT_1604820 [Lactarius hengduanensis]|nr:hypothetical protein EDB84DRAFT_1604820 [Lactarius hengduanensis]
MCLSSTTPELVHVTTIRDYHGSAKPVRVTGTGHAGTGQGSHSRTRAKPVPVARVPAGRLLSSHTLLALQVAYLRFSPSPHLYFGLGILTSLYDQNSPLEQLHTPSFCTSFDTESSSIVRREVAVASRRVAQHGRRRVALDTTIQVIIRSRSHVAVTTTTTATTREYDNDHTDEATPSTPTTTGYNCDHTEATTTTMATRRPQRGDHGEATKTTTGTGVTTTRWCDYDETTAATATTMTMG